MTERVDPTKGFSAMDGRSLVVVVALLLGACSKPETGTSTTTAAPTQAPSAAAVYGGHMMADGGYMTADGGYMMPGMGTHSMSDHGMQGHP